MAIVWSSPLSLPSPICHHFFPFVLHLNCSTTSIHNTSMTKHWCGRYSSMATMLPSLLLSTLLSVWPATLCIHEMTTTTMWIINPSLFAIPFVYTTPSLSYLFMTQQWWWCGGHNRMAATLLPFLLLSKSPSCPCSIYHKPKIACLIHWMAACALQSACKWLAVSVSLHIFFEKEDGQLFQDSQGCLNHLCNGGPNIHWQALVQVHNVIDHEWPYHEINARMLVRKLMVLVSTMRKLKMLLGICQHLKDSIELYSCVSHSIPSLTPKGLPTCLFLLTCAFLLLFKSLDVPVPCLLMPVSIPKTVSDPCSWCILSCQQYSISMTCSCLLWLFSIPSPFSLSIWYDVFTSILLLCMRRLIITYLPLTLHFFSCFSLSSLMPLYRTVLSFGYFSYSSHMFPTFHLVLQSSS